jgi:recombination protein RecT
MSTDTTTALAPTNGTALAAPSKNKTVRDWLSTPSFRDEIAKALPKHCTPDRFLRVALTALLKTPKLADCTPASVCNALLSLSQFGLEPDGRRAHLIPYGNQCTLIVDWKGLAELILRSGLVSYLHASEVCENDLFDYDLGEVKKHTVDFKKPRGKVYAFYSLCKFRDGTAKADVMTLDEVKAIQARSKAGRSGPWITDFNEMGKKTVFRRLSKWLPLSPEIRAAVEVDDDVIDIEAKQQANAGGLASLVDLPAMPTEDGPPLTGGEKNVTDTALPEYTAQDREKVIEVLQNRILDSRISAEAMLKQAKAQGIVGEKFDGELFELPTADLVRIVENGGAK